MDLAPKRNTTPYRKESYALDPERRTLIRSTPHKIHIPTRCPRRTEEQEQTCMQRGGQCSPGLDEKEDEETVGGCSLEGNQWRAAAGALASRHDLTLAWPAWSHLVCVEGRAGAGAGEWSVATECLTSHCWVGNVRFSGPLVLKTGRKIGIKWEIANLKQDPR
jgi:hypothetical protein